MCQACLKYETKIIGYQLAKNERGAEVTRKLLAAHKRKEHPAPAMRYIRENYGGTK